MSKFWLNINGRSLDNLSFFNYRINLQNYDGEATSRTKAWGVPIIRQGLGTFCNFRVSVAKTRADNDDLIYIIDMHELLGRTEFVQVIHRNGHGKTYTQYMYFTIGEYAINESTSGILYTSNIDLSFIAKQGF